MSRDHDHHAQHAKQAQHEILALEQIALPQVIARVEKRGSCSQADEQLEQIAHRILDVMAEHGDHWSLGISRQDQQSRAQQGQLRQPVCDVPLLLFQERIND